MSLKVCPQRLAFSALAGLAGICALAGSASAQSTVTASVQVYSGTGANGPANLVSNAVPLRPGLVTSARDVRVLDGSTEVPVHARVLATWPSDGSIRSLLLQFEAPSAKSYTLQLGATRTTSDRALVPVTWDVPTRIFTLPASYLSDSLIFWEQKPLGQTGFPAWDQKQISGYGSISTVGTATCASSDQVLRLDHDVVPDVRAHRRRQVHGEWASLGSSPSPGSNQPEWHQHWPVEVQRQQQNSLHVPARPGAGLLHVWRR